MQAVALGCVDDLLERLGPEPGSGEVSPERGSLRIDAGDGLGRGEEAKCLLGPDRGHHRGGGGLARLDGDGERDPGVPLIGVSDSIVSMLASSPLSTHLASRERCTRGAARGRLGSGGYRDGVLLGGCRVGSRESNGSTVTVTAPSRDPRFGW